jgi:hypothetical protein
MSGPKVTLNSGPRGPVRIKTSADTVRIINEEHDRRCDYGNECDLLFSSNSTGESFLLSPLLLLQCHWTHPCPRQVVYS